MRELEKIQQEVKGALTELLDMDRTDFRPVRLLVIGCSSSEILGRLPAPRRARPYPRPFWRCARPGGFRRPSNAASI